MAMLFGEFLVEKNVISEEALLDALLAQLRVIPSTAEVVHTENLMSPRQILSVLLVQQKRGTDFKSAAEGLGFWTHDIGEKVTQVQKNRTPLGEVLIQKGHLNFAALTKWLDAYVELGTTQTKAPVEKTNVTKTREFPKLDPLLVKEFSDLFEARMLPVLRAAEQSLKDEAIAETTAREAVQRAQAECVAVQAAASFLGATLTEKVARAAVTFFKSLSGDQNLKKTRGVLSLVVHIFDGHNQYIKIFQTEPALEKDVNLCDLHERFWKSVETQPERRKVG